MSVGSIIGGGFAFVRRQPGTVALWSAVYLVVALLARVAMRPFRAGVAAFQQQAAADAAAGIRTPPAFSVEAFGTLFLIEVAAAILGVIAFAAVVRAVASRGRDHFAFLRLGMDELRLIGLGILLFAIAFAAEIAALFVLTLVGVALGAALGKAAGVAVAALLGFVLVVGAIYVEVRISLAGVYTVLRRQIVIGPAWRATRERFWTLFGAYLLLTLVFAVVWLVVVALTSAPLLAAYLSFDPQAMQVAAQQQLARQAAGLTPALILTTAASAIVFVVMAVVVVASMTTAALELGGEAPGVTTP